ncbi:MAG: SDR family oxidoreductase [Candidatus Competibacteraceae bacterium]|jgi:2-keto-3-deoxy-L-fuconate dehydrogenase|nr:SDR family oxidoreductase [Candidatus Competibacteraceae bacterium]
MQQALDNKRILVTQADSFMGPAIYKALKGQGAEVITQVGSLVDPEEPGKVIAQVGKIDVLIINLAIGAPTTPAEQVTDDEWDEVFKALVHPLPRLTRAVLPQMLARASGKIIVIGSASALRGINRASTYSAARGAQLAYVQALGVEMAKHNIQVNAIAQNFVDNPSYFPEEIQANPKFQDRLKREVPLGRLVSANEDASFVAYLCSEAANCFVGQVFPVCGGWVPR